MICLISELGWLNYLDNLRQNTAENNGNSLFNLSPRLHGFFTGEYNLVSAAKRNTIKLQILIYNLCCKISLIVYCETRGISKLTEIFHFYDIKTDLNYTPCVKLQLGIL